MFSSDLVLWTGSRRDRKRHYRDLSRYDALDENSKAVPGRARGPIRYAARTVNAEAEVIVNGRPSAFLVRSSTPPGPQGGYLGIVRDPGWNGAGASGSWDRYPLVGVHQPLGVLEPEFYLKRRDGPAAWVRRQQSIPAGPALLRPSRTAHKRSPDDVNIVL